MTSSYPGGFDNLPTNRTNDDAQRDAHPADHNSAAAALNAVEETLGLNPQGGFSTVAERLAAAGTYVQGGDPGAVGAGAQWWQPVGSGFYVQFRDPTNSHWFTDHYSQGDLFSVAAKLPLGQQYFSLSSAGILAQTFGVHDQVNFNVSQVVEGQSRTAAIIPGVGAPNELAAENALAYLFTQDDAPSGGTFVLGVFGQPTAPLPWDASASAAQAAIEANLGVGNVAVTGGPLPGSGLSVELVGSYGATSTNPFLTVDISGLVGGSYKTNVVRIGKAAGRAAPMGSLYLRTDVGQVWVNGDGSATGWKQLAEVTP